MKIPDFYIPISKIIRIFKPKKPKFDPIKAVEDAIKRLRGVK